MSECIHGFEGTQCDICFPTAPPAPPRRAAAAPRSPSTRPPRRDGGTRPAVATFVPSETRVYLPLTIASLADALETGELRPAHGLVAALGSELGHELRGSAAVGDRPASEFVPFALSPDAAPWAQLRRGAEEPHWSAQARAVAPADVAVLVTSLGQLGPDVVVADGDAVGTWTRFATGDDDVRRMLGRLREDAERRESAEALVPGTVPFDVIQLVGVAHEPAKERVRALLSAHGRSTRVAVYPPWFLAG